MSGCIGGCRVSKAEPVLSGVASGLQSTGVV